MTPTCSIDASNFFHLVLDLSEISGKTFEEIIIDQVAALMKVCIRLTHSAKVESIGRHVDFMNRSVRMTGGGPLFSVNKGREREWLRTEDKKFYEVKNWMVPGPVWAKALILKKKMEEDGVDLKTAIKARGASKKTWYDIAVALGLGEKVGAPGYVKNAGKFRGGSLPQVGFAEKLMEVAAFYIEVRNDSLLLRNGASKYFRGRKETLDGYKILQSAIEQRRAAFRRDLEKGVFDDVSLRAKRYPGVFAK